jgi:hypothetical protein
VIYIGTCCPRCHAVLKREGCSIASHKAEEGEPCARELLRERIKAGIAHARRIGRPHGRPPAVVKHTTRVKALAAQGLSKSAIACRLGISRTSVRRLLG